MDNTEENIKASIGSIYASLLNKRAQEKEQREELKRIEKEAKEAEKAEKKDEEKEKLTKKEKRKKELDNWKNIVTSITGDDLEYSDKKTKKKKYHKWIDDDLDNAIKSEKKKKVKKKNYSKEFAPELNMLKALVAEQNRFTSDLQKRFMNAAGPATKDAAYPNKTLVELSSAINAGRSNSLGILREIGSVKKSIADLTMKQKKMDLDVMGNSNIDSTDLGLMGSSIASSLLVNNPYMSDSPRTETPMQQPVQTQHTQADPVVATVQSDESQYSFPTTPFDPSTWNFDIGDKSVMYENIPHQIYVEKKADTGEMRFVATRNDTGEEIQINSLPTVDPSKLSVDEKKMQVTGKFDEVYDLKII